MAAKLGLSGGDIIPTSSETRLGRDQVFSVIYKALSSKGEGDFDGDEDADIDVQQ